MTNLLKNPAHILHDMSIRIFNRHEEEWTKMIGKEVYFNEGNLLSSGILISHDESFMRVQTDNGHIRKISLSRLLVPID